MFDKLAAPDTEQDREVRLSVDRHGMIHSITDAACAFLCVDAEQAMGTLLWAFVVPDARESVASALARALTDGASRVTARMRPKKRSPRTRRMIFRARPDGIDVFLNERLVSQQIPAIRSGSRVVASVRKNLGVAPISVPPELEPNAERLGTILKDDLQRTVDVVVGWTDMLEHRFVTPEIQSRALGVLGRQARKQRGFLREANDHFDALFSGPGANDGAAANGARDGMGSDAPPSDDTDIQRVASSDETA